MFDVLIPAIIGLPLAGFLFTAVAGRRLGKRAHLVPVWAVGIAWVIGMIVAFSALTGAAPFDQGGHATNLYEWIPSGLFKVEAGFFVDNLTACLLIVVLTIGLLVHIYSIGYMSHDPSYWRFFSYPNPFIGSVLLLLLAHKFLLVFVALGVVGVSRYLL